MRGRLDIKNDENTISDADSYVCNYKHQIAESLNDKCHMFVYVCKCRTVWEQLYN
jgi:hypothetical protein